MTAGVLATATAGLTGCETGSRRPAAPAPSTAAVPPAEDPDVALVLGAAADEEASLAAAERLLELSPRLATRLAVTLAVHRSHLALLRRSDALAAAPTPSPGTTSPGLATPGTTSPGSTSPGTTSPSAPVEKPVRTGRAALTALLRAEQRLQRQQTDRALAARSGQLARVLAAMAAAAAQQVVVVSEAQRDLARLLQKRSSGGGS